MRKLKKDEALSGLSKKKEKMSIQITLELKHFTFKFVTDYCQFVIK